jgi:hypothetical protein|nr:hypothetical protein [uncultured Clostridium sp.]
MDKKISEMTKEEILRQQLELLAEASKNDTCENLLSLTNAMVEVCDRL